MAIRLVIDMEYLAKDQKSGRYRYRRRVPGPLVRIFGKREFSVSLKTSEHRVALERYQHVHRDVEAEISAAKAIDPEEAEHKAAMQALRKHGLVEPHKKRVEPVRFEDDPQKFKEFTEAALGAPDHEFDHIVEAKFFGVEEPPLRLSKAVDAYLEEQRDEDNEKDLRKQTELATKLLRDVMKDDDPLVEAVDIDVAYAFRDRLRNEGRARGTVQRRINTIRAVLNFAKKRYQLTSFVNPFSNLEVPKGAGERRAKDKRLPLTVEEIKRCTPYMLTKNDSIADHWIIMTFTGARPRELLGLEWQDVELEHPVPHIIVQPNSIRGVKNETSIRKVPLVGRAFEVLQARAEGKLNRPGFTGGCFVCDSGGVIDQF